LAGGADRARAEIQSPALAHRILNTMPVRAIGINHIAFEVDDLDRALDWYGRYFEFTLRGRRARMAWIDLGDQFLALSESSGTAAAEADRGRHVGFVVADKEALRAALKAGGEDVADSGSLRVRDPSGNQLEIVDYRDVQFSKAPEVLAGMGLTELEKSSSAIGELRDKGLA
jgi:catechol 2,3-dioxygenase-like lactoylglutathione lyase family enzyme